MKVGFIQSGAIGDIVIALPAAKWYVDRGYDVFWPIDYRYISFFQRAAPYVNFLTVPAGVSSYEWHLGVPNQLLSSLQVSDIFTLYSYLGSDNQRFEFGQPPLLPDQLKFDEYKYAIANVPFSEKWNLVINRNPDGEAKVLEAIEAHLPYSIVHDAHRCGRDIVSDLGTEIIGRVVRIQEITDSPFDWIAAFERATMIASVDSLHANIIEQLNILIPKYMYLHAQCSFNPVFKNGWKFR